jgi:hypothetical protein
MIKPNLIFSHDWHVQPICQRSLRAIRLSGPFGSRPSFRQGVLELVALTDACIALYRRFCANLSNISNFVLYVNLLAVFFSSGLRRAPVQKLALRKISNNDQQTALEPLGLAGDELLGHAMACSLWDSLQGFRGTCLT